ncbi:hypothetical protein NW754_016278 [Fusarium falciforme]|nr:hypothetical protein NW765_016893 [Fusarium oxysporum]KAJ4136695.1 hypothetical protein NW754_016278 [Fusarium falciforme]
MPRVTRRTRGSSTAPYVKPAKRSLLSRIDTADIPRAEDVTYTLPVKEDYTGKLHLWEIPVHMPKHIAEAGKPAPRPPKPVPLAKRIWTEEEKLAASITAMENLIELRELNKLKLARDKLNKRIAAKQAAKEAKQAASSLALRLSSPAAGPSVPANHKILDPSLVFGKKKPLQACDQVIPMLEGTLTRLTPLANHPLITQASIWKTTCVSILW